MVLLLLLHYKLRRFAARGGVVRVNLRVQHKRHLVLHLALQTVTVAVDVTHHRWPHAAVWLSHRRVVLARVVRQRNGTVRSAIRPQHVHAVRLVRLIQAAREKLGRHHLSHLLLHEAAPHECPRSVAPEYEIRVPRRARDVRGVEEPAQRQKRQTILARIRVRAALRVERRASISCRLRAQRRRHERAVRLPAHDEVVAYRRLGRKSDVVEPAAAPLHLSADTCEVHVVRERAVVL
mmetsp:Transcript_5577/g.14492  ORF Transcript_5577/g.14492 Transcript_5577/m.14492 type:complete len:236 (+) Transcript_5577:14-721(+)